MEGGVEEVVYQEKKSQAPPVAERIPQYWQYFHVWLLRRNDRRAKFKLAVKYVFLPMAVSALFAGTILVGYRHQGRRSSEGSRKTASVAFSADPKIAKDSACVCETNALTCTALDLSNSPQPLLEQLQKCYDKGESTVRLRLINVQYKNNRTNKGWLPVLDNVHPAIQQIILEGPTLIEIGDQSLSGFTKLQGITITNTGITYLTKNAFEDVKNVWEFNLRDNKYLTAVETGILTKFTLQTFQLQGMDLTDENKSVKFFQNLTDSTYIASVSTIDLMYNSMGTLRKAYIQYFIKATQIFISQSGIHSVEQSAFSSFSSTTSQSTIDLSGNVIETIEEDVFGSLLQNKLITLRMANNPIKCDCDMKWLQDYYFKYNITGDYIYLKCSSPPELESQNLLEVDLCQGTSPTYSPTKSTTTSTTTTTESVPSSTSTTQPPSPDSEVCQLTHKNIRRTAYTVREVYESGSLSLEISFGAEDNPVVLAFQDRQSEEMKCQYMNLQENQEHKISVRGISQNRDYLFCFYDEKDVQTGYVSFHDCMAYKTAPALKDQPWITHGEKPLMIIYIICGVVGALVIGGLIAFCIVRKVPTLLKGSDRVEIVKSRNGETVLIMPEKFECPPTPTGIYETISGYISHAGHDFRDKLSPPPLPPYPPSLRKCRDEHEYLEPRFLAKLPRNADLLLEYEWYTTHTRQDDSGASHETPTSSFYAEHVSS